MPKPSKKIVPAGELDGAKDVAGIVEVLARIVPAGELDGAKDQTVLAARTRGIVPAGELDGAKDHGRVLHLGLGIVPAGELDGAKDLVYPACILKLATPMPLKISMTTQSLILKLKLSAETLKLGQPRQRQSSSFHLAETGNPSLR